MKKILLLISFFIIVSYLVLIQIRYGSMASISRSAKYLTADNIEYLFFIFIWSIGITAAYVGNSILSALGTGILTAIGTITGYNPDILSGNEHLIHIICAVTAITLGFADIINKGMKTDKPAIPLISVVLFIIYSISAYFLQKNYVYWIEIIAIIIIFTYYFYYVSSRVKKTNTV